MSAARPEPGPGTFGPEDFARAAGVSRETLARLKSHVGLLTDWNARHNLVSARSLDDVWRRHVWDSAQLAPLIPAGARTLIDLGSGAGFPGLVLAVLRPELKVVLVDSTAKKANFLKGAAARISEHVEVRTGRLESLPLEAFDAVTARACAPLAVLLSYAQRFQGPATVNLLLKGQSVEVELTEARKSWKMQVVKHPSRTDPSGTILEIRELRHAGSRTG
ncbi:MAG TPA: 16S rRNA (guanine(527)-N(7))-methyltransferase RsmG [Rhizomicrobium sp.]|nr:16S rRNA (guanine(527)-N(7))-methyltransferase RsmG [Rhizomicrobium sp.]